MKKSEAQGLLDGVKWAINEVHYAVLPFEQAQGIKFLADALMALASVEFVGRLSKLAPARSALLRHGDRVISKAVRIKDRA